MKNKIAEAVKAFKDFAHKELSLFNSLYSGKEFVPNLAHSRAQIRLVLASQHIHEGLKEDPTEDYLFLIECVIAISKRDNYKVNHKLLVIQRLLTIKESTFTYKLSNDETRIERMFLYSIMDFLRIVEFESEAESIFDLNRFATITDKFLPQ